MPSMDEIQQSIFDALSAYEPTAEGLETDEEKAAFDAFMTEQLAGLGAAEADKADAYGYAIRHAEAEAEFFKREAERFTTRRRIVENRIKTMKDRIAFILREYNIKEIKGARYKLALHRSQRVVIENESLLATSYFRIIPETREPDKKAIGDALKAGTEIKGASLEEAFTTVIR